MTSSAFTGRPFSLLLSVTALACGGKTPLQLGEQGPASDGGGPAEAGGAGGEPAGGAGGEPVGGESGSGGSSIPIPPICTEYCEAAALKGCPPAATNCEINCALLFPGDCEDAVTAFLSCAPAQTIASCEIAYGSDGPSGVCMAADDELYSCGSCEIGGAQTANGGCEGSYSCGIATDCDANGACSCTINGLWVGGCTAIIGGIDACSPGLSCCRMYF